MSFLRGCAIVFLFLALFFGGIYAVEDWRGARAWEATVRYVQAHGGATDLASIIPPPIPDDQNLAMAPFFVKALNYQIDPETKLLTFGMPKNDTLLEDMPWGKHSPSRSHPTTNDWQQGRPADLLARQTYFRADPEFPRAPDPQSPADGVLMALSRYKAPLDEVAAAATARPRSRFPINWATSDLAGPRLPHFLILRNLAAALSIRASAEAVSGKQTAAVADIALGFRLSEAIHSEPFLIGELVSRDMIGMMQQPIWDGLASKGWDAGQLRQLQALLSSQDTLASYASAMRGEETFPAHIIDSVEKRRRHTDALEVLAAC